MGRYLAAGEEPYLIAMRLPDLAKHLEHWLGQRKNTLLVAFADDVEEHLLRVYGGDGKAEGFRVP